jgi:hypothetical protein
MVAPTYRPDHVHMALHKNGPFVRAAGKVRQVGGWSRLFSESFHYNNFQIKILAVLIPNIDTFQHNPVEILFSGVLLFV